MSDPRKYRTKEEEASYIEGDPIEKVLKTIKKNKWLSEKQIEAIQDEVKGLVKESVEFAENSPEPVAEDIYEGVYDQEDYPFIID